MSKVQTLRVFVTQRLTAAAEEIFELFERTIAEYEEEVCRQRKLLDAVFRPEVQLHRAEVQQQFQTEDEGRREPQAWSSGLTQEEPRHVKEEQEEPRHVKEEQEEPRHVKEEQEEPRHVKEEQEEPRHVKEEQEELWSHQEEADVVPVTFTAVPVKSEEDDDEEKPQSSQMKTEAEEDHRGAPEPGLERHLHPDENSPSSEAEADEEEVMKSKEPPSGSDVRGCKTSAFCCSECGKTFDRSSKLDVHMRVHTGEKPFSCSLCLRRYTQKSALVLHLKTHAGEKPYGCSRCGKRFLRYDYLLSHLRIHTGEKPFGCSLCGKHFSQRGGLDYHLKTHERDRLHGQLYSQEKPYSCPLCFKRFTRNGDVQVHMRVHTGEKPFGCSVCLKRFSWRYQVKRHKCVRKSSQPHRLRTNQTPADGFTFMSVKSEEADEEGPQSSQLHHRQTDRTGAEPEDSGRPGPARNQGPSGLAWNPFI